MSLEDIRRKAEEAARQAKDNLTKDENVIQAEITESYKFLQDNGVDTSSISIDFENNTFTLNGTVETGEELENLTTVITNSGSENPIVNNVDLEDFTAKNIMLTVKTKGSNLNVRAGAGTDNEIVGKFPNGAEVNLIKKIQQDWYLVRKNEVEGYCHTNFLAEA